MKKHNVGGSLQMYLLAHTRVTKICGKYVFTCGWNLLVVSDGVGVSQCEYTMMITSIILNSDKSYEHSVILFWEVSILPNKFFNWSVTYFEQALFDPINPDKDTIATRELNRREKLDNEFWLLQKLEAIMEKANFKMLPKEEVKKSLEEHKARNGVIVSRQNFNIWKY